MRGGILSHPKRGITLPEVLTAAIVLAVIVGSVSGIYATAMRTWYLGAAETFAEQKAAWVIQRMAPDLREAMSVTPASPPNESVYVVLRAPAKSYDTGEGTYLNQVAVDAYGAPYLQAGDYVIYYRGNEHGALDATGDSLWRRVVQPNGTIVKQYVVADNIVDNPVGDDGLPRPMFTYWPDVYHLRSVAVMVTVEESRGHRTARKTMTGELSLRNN